MSFESFINSSIAWTLAGIGSLIAICFSLYNIYQHITYYTIPSQQIYIIRILFIIPLYAINSFLSLIFFEQSLYFEIIRDIYESFVIYKKTKN